MILTTRTHIPATSEGPKNGIYKVQAILLYTNAMHTSLTHPSQHGKSRACGRRKSADGRVGSCKKFLGGVGPLLKALHILDHRCVGTQIAAHQQRHGRIEKLSSLSNRIFATI